MIDKKYTKLAIEIKPFKDEIFSSWLIRNSIANGSDPSSLANAIWIDLRVWSRDIGRYFPSDKINKLTQITSLNLQDVKNMTLELIVKQITNDDNLNPKKAWLYVIPTGQRGGIYINGTQFCKECLKSEIPYIKKQWRLAWNVACPIHKILLEYKCQNCNFAYSPYKIDFINTKLYICTNCGFDLRESKSIYAENELILFQEDLNHIALSNEMNNSFSMLISNKSELFLTIRSLIPLMKYLYHFKKYNLLFKDIKVNQTYRFKKYSNGTTFETMSIEDRAYILLIVSKLLLLDLEKIKELLIKHHVSKKILLSNITLTTKTIKYLSDNLVISNKVKGTFKIKKRSIIKPRTKKEVDILMDEILTYL